MFTVIWKVKNWHEYFLSTSTKEMHFNFLDCNVKSAEMKVNSLNFGIGVVVKWQKKFWDTIKALNYMICLVTHQCSVVLAHMIVILSLCSSTRVHVYHRYNKRKLCQIARVLYNSSWIKICVIRLILLSFCGNSRKMIENQFCLFCSFCRIALDFWYEHF